MFSIHVIINGFGMPFVNKHEISVLAQDVISCDSMFTERSGAVGIRVRAAKPSSESREEALPKPEPRAVHRRQVGI